MMRSFLLDLEDRITYALGRMACKALRCHNRSCRGRLDHKPQESPHV